MKSYSDDFISHRILAQGLELCLDTWDSAIFTELLTNATEKKVSSLKQLELCLATWESAILKS